MATRSAKGFSDAPEAQDAKAPESPKSDALQTHQQYEGIAKALTVTNDNRLGSLLNAVVSQRKASVGQFVDVLEAVDTGELDLMLIAQEMEQRRERRKDSPSEFRIDQSPANFGIDLNGSRDCVELITGFSAAKAIAGV